jgi:gamma-glutamyltranspeptidase/glutathione hydrolase
MTLDASFRSRRSHVVGTRGMVATSQPLAAQVGLRVLMDGGNAADAAVAVAAALNVVEPVSCGVGGDAFVLFRDGATGEITALNGSGRAPAAASLDELRRDGHERMPTFTAHTVTVPGAVAAWCDLLDRHGTMPLAEVLAPAIGIAERGYGATEWIARHWARQEKKLRRDPTWESGDPENGPPQPSGDELLPGGRAPRLGELVRLPELGRTLRVVAEGGREAFYGGEPARAIAEHVQRYGGWITEEDLAAHASTWDEPISADYRGLTLWECPPNGQGIAALVALRLAEGFRLGELAEPDRTHVAVECMRRGRADAARYVGDPACVDVPIRGLLADETILARRGRIDCLRASPTATPAPLDRGTDTIYASVVDGHGNACSFIGSLFMGTGTGLVPPGTGIALQNRGALFDLDPEHPNALAPGRRPFHTIIPALTTRGGELDTCFGVMGGPMQPQGHLQVIVHRIDRGLPPQPTLDAPRWRLESRPGEEDVLHVEEGWSEDTLAELERRGHRIERVEGSERIGFGAGQIIRRDPETGVLVGASDPRADGAAVGW